jgi:hypothetical protein
MQSPDETRNETQRLMLLAEIDSAEAMLAMVKRVQDSTVLREYRQSALQTYEGCLQLILRISMTHQEELAVWNRLAPIRRWLEIAGLLER